MGININWGPIIAQLIAVALPQILKHLPELIDAIFGWFLKASDKEVAALGKKAGKFLKAAQTELA